MLIFYILRTEILATLNLMFTSYDWRPIYAGYRKQAIVRLRFADAASYEAARATLAARADVELLHERRPVRDADSR